MPFLPAGESKRGNQSYDMRNRDLGQGTSLFKSRMMEKKVIKGSANEGKDGFPYKK